MTSLKDPQKQDQLLQQSKSKERNSLLVLLEDNQSITKAKKIYPDLDLVVKNALSKLDLKEPMKSPTIRAPTLSLDSQNIKSNQYKIKTYNLKFSQTPQVSNSNALYSSGKVLNPVIPVYNLKNTRNISSTNQKSNYKIPPKPILKSSKSPAIETLPAKPAVDPNNPIKAPICWPCILKQQQEEQQKQKQQQKPIEIEVTKEFRNLGTKLADPIKYTERFGPKLLTHEDFKQKATKIGAPKTIFNLNNQQSLPELEGDLEALKYVDLDRVGLSEYKPYLNKLGIQVKPNPGKEVNRNEMVTLTDLNNLVSIDQIQKTFESANKFISTEDDIKSYLKSIDK